MLHHLVNLGNAQAPGAFQAIALVQSIAVFYFRYKNNCNIFLALDAHLWLHRLSLLFGVCFEAKYSTFEREKEKQFMNSPYRLVHSNFSIPSSYHRWVMYSPPGGTVGPAAVRLPESRIWPISSGRIFPSAQ